jgi:hypothetical protein
MAAIGAAMLAHGADDSTLLDDSVRSQPLLDRWCPFQLQPPII